MAPATPILRLTMLLHDIGKPSCLSFDEYSEGHFHGHANISAAMAKEILQRLRFDNKTIKLVATLVEHHDRTFEVTEKGVIHLLNKMSADEIRILLQVRKADILGQGVSISWERIAPLNKVSQILNKVLEDKKAFTLKDLAINGNDLISIGYQEGPQIGKLLQIMLELVIDGKLDNQKETLLAFIKERSGKKNV